MTLWEGVHPVKTTINFTFRFLDYDRLRPEDETTCTDGTASIGSIIKKIMEPKDILKHFGPQLLQLPVNDAGFAMLLKQHDLLPGDTRESLSNKTPKEAAMHLIDTIENSLSIGRESYDRLIIVMKKCDNANIRALAAQMETASGNPPKSDAAKLDSGEQMTGVGYGENPDFHQQSTATPANSRIGNQSPHLTIVEIVLYIICALFSLGVLIAAAISLSTINTHISEKEADNVEIYRSIAIFVVFVGIVGFIMQVVFMIIRCLYYGNAVKARFTIFGTVAVISTFLLGLAFLTSIGLNAQNADDVQTAIDEIESRCAFEDEDCENLSVLMESQIAAAVISSFGAVTCIILIIILIINVVKMRNTMQP